MKHFLNSRWVLSFALTVALGTSAFAAENNKFTIPQVAGQHGRPLPLPKQDFARLAHQDNLEACVNEVARACDGHFSRKIVRALTRGGRDVAEPGQLANALKSMGITSCGHYSSQSGKTQMEAFFKKRVKTQRGIQSNLILFGTSYNKPCSHAVIQLPEMAQGMRVTANRAYVLGGSGKVYYTGADFKVRALSQTGNNLVPMAEGTKINIGTAILDSNETAGTEAVVVERPELRFDENSVNDLFQ